MKPSCAFIYTEIQVVPECVEIGTLFPGDGSISVTTIHHQSSNMQIVLISVLGDCIKYSNVPPYLNGLSFIFASPIQWWPRSSVTAGAHADRWSRGTVIGRSYCHSSPLYMIYRAEKGDARLRRRGKKTQNRTQPAACRSCTSQCPNISPRKWQRETWSSALWE